MKPSTTDYAHMATGLALVFTGLIALVGIALAAGAAIEYLVKPL